MGIILLVFVFLGTVYSICIKKANKKACGTACHPERNAVEPKDLRICSP